MNKEAWRDLAVSAVVRHQAGDDTALDLLGRLLEEQEQAKDLLRNAGYGWTGTGLLETARKAIADRDHLRGMLDVVSDAHFGGR